MATTSLIPRDPEQLRETMRRAGFDMTTLAQIAGVTQQFVSLLFRGKRRCRPEVADAIAQALGASTGSLFTPSLSDETNNTESDMAVRDVVRIDDPYLEFADVLELAVMRPGTLRHYRVTGKGPEFFRMGGRLKIRRSKALAWIERYENGELDDEPTSP